MRIKRIIREYFTYTAREKRGLLVLLFLLFVVYFIPLVVNRNDSDSNSLNLEKQKELNAILAEMTKEKAEENQLKPFSFDPNTITIQELEKMGLKQFQIKNLVKYRENGGRFSRKEDLQKIYGIKLEHYKLLEPHIQIRKNLLVRKSNKVKSGKILKSKEVYLFEFDPNTISLDGWDSLGVSKKVSRRIKNYLATGAKFHASEDLKKIYGFDSIRYLKLAPYIKITDLPKMSMIELNSATVEQLQALPGIGPVLSNRILKYKNRLGGFSSKGQLKEVFGLSTETFVRIESCVIVDKSLIQELNLNVVKLDQLKKHPYISFRQAMDLMRYRERKGKFQNIEDINKLNLLPDSVYVKVRPYLKI